VSNSLGGRLLLERKVSRLSRSLDIHSLLLYRPWPNPICTNNHGRWWSGLPATLLGCNSRCRFFELSLLPTFLGEVRRGMFRGGWICGGWSRHGGAADEVGRGWFGGCRTSTRSAIRLCGSGGHMLWKAAQGMRFYELLELLLSSPIFSGLRGF